jgi:hypothetical protein
MISSFASDKVRVIVPSITDDRGKEIYDYDNPVREFEIKNCSLQPSVNNADKTNDEFLALGSYKLFVNPTIEPLKLYYKIIGKAQSFKVLKLPAKWTGATGKLNHNVYELDYWGSN